MFVPDFKIGDTGELFERGYHVKEAPANKKYPNPRFVFKGIEPGRDTMFYMFESVVGKYPYSVTELDFELKDCCFKVSGNIEKINRRRRNGW